MGSIFWSLFNRWGSYIRKLINKYILNKNLPLEEIFTQLDQYWLRHHTETYTGNTLRLIIAMIGRSVSDYYLSEEELISLVDYIQRNWVKNKALNKLVINNPQALNARIESDVTQAIIEYEALEKTPNIQKITPEKFVLSLTDGIERSEDGWDIRIRSKVHY